MYHHNAVQAGTSPALTPQQPSLMTINERLADRVTGLSAVYSRLKSIHVRALGSLEQDKSPPPRAIGSGLVGEIKMKLEDLEELQNLFEMLSADLENLA